MIPAPSPFAHQANSNPPASIAIVRGGHLRLAEHHLIIEWFLVPTAYSFTQFGAGDASIEPPNLFTYIGVDDIPKDLHATVEGVSKVKLSGGRVVPRHLPFSSNEPKFSRCWPKDKQEVQNAIREAQRLVDRAIAEIEGSDHTNFVTWFGGYSDYMANRVKENLIGFKACLNFAGYTIKCGYYDLDYLDYCDISKQLQGRCSVTDTSLDQSPVKEKSRSTNNSI